MLYLYYKVLVFKAQAQSDEDRLMRIIFEVYQSILSLPNSILRPYQSHIRSDSGSNRLRSLEDLEFRFGIDSVRVLRFSVNQIEEIAEVMEV